MKTVKKRPPERFRTASATFEGKGSRAAIDRISQIFEALLLTDGTPGHPPAANPQGDFSPVEILFHRLQVSSSPAMYSYLEGSGIYRNSDNPDDDSTMFPVTGLLKGFIKAYINDGDLSEDEDLVYRRSLYNMTGAGAPNILVKNQCFVVVEINGASDLRIAENKGAIDVDDANYNNDYCQLVHYDATGTPWNNKTPAPNNGVSNPCLLFSFSVETPYRADNHDDRYNLYLQSGPNTSPTFITVDPFIKNRGNG